MIPELDTVQKFLQPARTPLLWRIIPWTFFSVGLAQLVSLYPLMQWHRHQLYDHRVEITKARLETALNSAALEKTEEVAHALNIAMTPNMRGLGLYSASGQLISLQGEAPVSEGMSSGRGYSYAQPKPETLVVSWTLPGGNGLGASATLDISEERKRQEEFVLRAVLLSVPSALIATLIGCFILLRGVILPVRRLRDELLARDEAHVATTEDVAASIDELDDLRSFVDRLAQARASAQAMETLATTDELTSVYTRRYFKEALERHLSLAQDEHAELSVVTIDIDFFKSINDTYGHATGDEVLKHVAQTCRDTLRAGDTLARFGGEEFVVLLPNTGVEGAGAVSEKVRQAIEKSVRIPRPVTASLGTSTWQKEKDPTGEQMLRHADEALYVAKRTGRNRVVQYELTPRKMAS